MKCKMCGNEKYSTLVNFKKDGIKVVKCRNCDLVQLDPITVKTLNNADDYEGLEDITLAYEYFYELRFPQFQKDLQIIQKYFQKSNLVDIGSSYGLFLSVAKEKGFNVAGFEPSLKSVEICRKKFKGLKVINREFNPSEIPFKKTDVFTMWSVFEHIMDPDALLKKITKEMGKDSLLCIRVPNYNSLLARLIIIINKASFGLLQSPARALYLMDSEYKHFFHYTISTLGKMLERNGLSIVESYKENSLRYDLFSLRKRITEREGDLNFMNNPLSKFVLLCVLKFSELFSVQDEIVIFCKKKSAL
jgi:2-polyprenyl-3-methyl-5-hydroxy-6-metoxy-1,4-benzoquinol methylase